MIFFYVGRDKHELNPIRSTHQDMKICNLYKSLAFSENCSIVTIIITDHISLVGRQSHNVFFFFFFLLYLSLLAGIEKLKKKTECKLIFHTASKSKIPVFYVMYSGFIIVKDKCIMTYLLLYWIRNVKILQRIFNRYLIILFKFSVLVRLEKK